MRQGWAFPLILFAAIYSGCATWGVSPRRAGPSITELLRSAPQIPEDPGSFPETAPSHPDVRTELKQACLAWPIRLKNINSAFGARHGKAHIGLDLRVGTGTPVRAAMGGIVLYADDRISGYGKTILIRHPRGLSTLYAHNSKLWVQPGQRVTRGQIIAHSGRTGRATGPHLHFELRDGTDVIDPLKLFSVTQGRALSGTGAGDSCTKAIAQDPLTPDPSNVPSNNRDSM